MQTSAEPMVRKPRPDDALKGRRIMLTQADLLPRRSRGRHTREGHAWEVEPDAYGVVVA